MKIDNNVADNIHIDHGNYFPWRFLADLEISESKIIWEKSNKKILFKVKNSGIIDSKSFNIKIGCKYLEGKIPRLTRPSSKILSTIRIPSLKRGETKKIIHNLIDENMLYTPDAFAFANSIYELTFKVDSANEIRESNESNNILRLIKYKIYIKTSNAYGSGTDANVSIKLYGKDSESPFINIGNKNDNFEKGQLDAFEIFYEDIGNIEKIEIKHDNSGEGDSWLLEKVTIQSHNGTNKFTSNNWISWGRENVQPSIVIKEDSKRFKYAVKVKTSNKADAGTRASVFIQLYGKDNKTSSFQKIGFNNINDFKRGAENVFFIYVDNYIGDIHKIGLRHDNYVDGADWHIESITINDSTHFDINEWIGKNTSKEHPHKFFISNELKIEKSLPKVDYTPGEIEEYTDSAARAKQWNIEWNEVDEDLDTKAYRNLIRSPYIQNVTPHSAVVVWRTIATRKQAYAKVILYDARTEKVLNSYSTNSNTIITKDVTSSYVYDNNDLFKDDDQLNVKGSGQYRPNLEYRVTFNDLEPNTVYEYHIIAKGEDENKRLITHTVANKIMFKTAPAQDSNEIVKFVAMGDFGQGDDRPSYYYDVFDVFHKVVRERGVDYWLALGDIDNCTDGHPNAIDPFFFSVYNAYMNETPKKTSNLKFGQSTTVKAFRTPPYYGILGGMPVYPTFGNHDIRDAQANYDKVDKYSSWKQAYKSSFVFPSTQEDSWSSYAYQFNKKGEGFFYTFRYGNVISISLAVPGAKDDYNTKVTQQINKQNILLEAYLEQIKHITDNDNIWLIVYAHDHHILDKNYKIYNYNELFHKYNVNIVLSGHNHFYKERVSHNQNMLTGFSSNTKYELVHFISGTGGYGDNDSFGSAPSRRPGFVSFEIKGNKLRYCKYDSHECDANGYPVGGRDGFSPHIEEQGELLQRGGKIIYSSCNLPVFEGEAYIPPRTLKYTIKVKTGNVVSAGTDADVFIKLYGTKGETAFIQLDNTSDNFESNDNDSFNILYEDIGNITKIKVKHDNRGNNAGWFLEKIIITKNNSIYNFTAQQWLSHSSRNVEPSITIKEDSTRVKYTVSIKTSSSKNAGTDAGIYIQLFGTNNKSTPLQRINHANYDDFEKGSIGTYTIYSDENLGEINKIKLEHDNTGDGSWWKIDTVVVNNLYTFNIYGWLGDDNKSIHPNKIFTR